MTTKSRKVSPSIHEGLIDRHFAVDRLSQQRVPDDVLEDLRDAMLGARLASEKAARIADVIMQNEMQTVAARHRQVKEEAWRVVEPALRRLDQVVARASREIADIDARTAAPPKPTDASGNILAGEIRSRLAMMKPSERKKALDAALGEDDDVVIGAVLNAPPMLSGISGREAQDVLRAQWRQKRHGPDVDRSSRVGKALADVERGGQLVISFASGLSDDVILKRAEASERAVAEAINS